jgi:hypothetical protein
MHTPHFVNALFMVHGREGSVDEILRKADENGSLTARDGFHAKISHSVETEGKLIDCAPLPSMLHDFFALLP